MSESRWATALKILRDLVLLIARVALGVTLVARGWRRWQVNGLDAEAAYLRETQTPYADVAAVGSVFVEMIGGVLLILGALTPVVAGIIVVEQIMIIAWTSWFRGLALDGPWGHGWEYTMVSGVLALVFVVYGAGRASVDTIVRTARARRPDFDDDYGPG